MMEVIAESPSYDYERSNYENHLVEEMGGISVNLSNSVLAAHSDWNQEESAESYEQLTWLTDSATFKNRLKNIGLTYGNEVSLETIYCSPCFIVEISPAIDRV